MNVPFFFSPSLPSRTHTHTIPFCLSNHPAFPIPNPIRRPVTHCAGKSDFLFSEGSKLKAEPGRRMRSHILGLSADPRGPASLPGCRKKSRGHGRLSGRKHLALAFLSFSPPTPCSGLHVNRDQRHTLEVSSACRSWCVCVCVSEGLLPIGSLFGRAGMN